MQNELLKLIHITDDLPMTTSKRQEVQAIIKKASQTIINLEAKVKESGES